MTGTTMVNLVNKQAKIAATKKTGETLKCCRVSRKRGKQGLGERQFLEALGSQIGLWAKQGNRVSINVANEMVGVGHHHASVQWPHTPMDERQRGNSAAVTCQERPWPPWTVPR